MSVYKIWNLKSPSPSPDAPKCEAALFAGKLASEAGIAPLQAQLLINRNISDIESVRSFISPSLRNMIDPMLMKGMKEATETIITSIAKQEKITIYGDYDADGLTATALLVNFFSDLGIQVSSYIPNRLNEGYGLNMEAVFRIAEKGSGLLITVDCGSSNFEEIEFAKKSGIKVVVTDHHQIPDGFQPLCPVVNPNQPGCPFPFKELAGVGLAFFLAVAVRAGLRKKDWFKPGSEPDLREYLDLVALGTVADRVPLLDQNRILVNNGMEVMKRSRWAGINAMQEVAAIPSSEITPYDLAFKLAPCLNAPGRMGNPDIGLRILTQNKNILAMDFAEKINAINKQRRGIEKEILAQIETILGETRGINDLKTIVISGEGWHKGVLGIVASRLVDKYHRPSLVIGIKDGMAYGSGRSIDNFNLYSALSRIKYVFEKFGGHAHAAGFSLKASNVRILKKELEAIAGETIKEKDLIPTIDVDAEILLKDITPETLLLISALSPFGQGNPAPLFLSRSLEVLDSRVVGKRHLKFSVCREKEIFGAIGFGLANHHPLRGRTIDMIFTPEWNRWHGYESIQLKVVDLKNV